MQVKYILVDLFSSSEWNMRLLSDKTLDQNHDTLCIYFLYVKITLKVYMHWKVRNLEKWSFNMIFVWVCKMLAHKIGEPRNQARENFVAGVLCGIDELLAATTIGWNC